MKTGLADFKGDLSVLSPAMFVSRWLLERVPHLFGQEQNSYLEWKHFIGERIGVDPRAVSLVGSAATGFSLSPQKAFQPFQESSDVDVAVVSAHHFDLVWRWMRTLGSERYGYPGYVQKIIDDHRTRLVYFGAIATDRFLQYTPIGKEWLPVLSEAGKRLPGGVREVNVRLYREFEALRAYQVNCCNAVKEQHPRT